MKWFKVFQQISPVDQVQVYWILQGDSRFAFVPAGSNEEIKVTLVPRFSWRRDRELTTQEFGHL